MPKSLSEKTARVELKTPERKLEAWRRAAFASQMTLSEWIRARCDGVATKAASAVIAPEER